MSRTVQVQVNTNNFTSFNPISTVIFLSLFEVICDTNGKHEKTSTSTRIFAKWYRQNWIVEERRDLDQLLYSGYLSLRTYATKQYYQQYRWGDLPFHIAVGYDFNRVFKKLFERNNCTKIAFMMNSSSREFSSRTFTDRQDTASILFRARTSILWSMTRHAISFPNFQNTQSVLPAFCTL